MGGTVARWCRGCTLIFTLIAAPALSQDGSVDASVRYKANKLDLDELAVPSGMEVSFLEMVWDERGQAGLTYRFRFVAADLTGQDFEAVSADMEHLCTAYALPRLSLIGPKPSQIVISLAESETEFGEAAPEVLQYFEAYSISEDRCIWELF